MNLALHIPPLDHVRPLSIGAARWNEFEALCPPAWTGAIVLAQLFKNFDMDACGWKQNETELDDLGFRNGARRWRVSRK